MIQSKIKPVVIYAREDARQVMHAARESGVSPWLITPKGAASYLGGGYIKSLIRTLEREYTKTPFKLSVDCHDRAGRVLNCLKYNIKDVIFTGDPQTLEKLRQIAVEHGAHIEPIRPEALDIRTAYGYEKKLKLWWGIEP